MGLAQLRKILAPEPCQLAELSGQRLAVDANNMLWTFVTGMGARGDPPTGPHGRPISHVIGLTNRLRLYASHSVESVWVFDGQPPKLKQDTLAERQARLEETGGPRLTGQELEEARELLDLLGVPTVQAPCEADAQLAHMVEAGLVDGAVTQDYDAALFGSPVTYRNVTSSTKRPAERMVLEQALTRETLTHEQLVDAAILIGTDYNDGIRGVGPVTALKLVREHGDLFSALDARGAEMPEASGIRALFLDHKVDEKPSVEPRASETDGARAWLSGHGISRGRTDALLDAMGSL